MDPSMVSSFAQWGPVWLLVGVLLWMLFTLYRAGEKSTRESVDKLTDIVSTLNKALDALCNRWAVHNQETHDALVRIEGKVDTVQKKVAP